MGVGVQGTEYLVGNRGARYSIYTHAYNIQHTIPTGFMKKFLARLIIFGPTS